MIVNSNLEFINQLYFFYNFDKSKLFFINKEIFKYENIYYYLKYINDKDDFLVFNDISHLFHQAIKNKYNFYVSLFINKPYIVYKLNSENIEYNYDFLKYIMSINIDSVCFNNLNNNFILKWIRQIDIIEKHFLKDYSIMLDNNVYYFINIAELSLSYLNMLNGETLLLSLSLKTNMIDCCNDYNSLFPFNYSYKPIVFGIADYIKYSFFYNGEAKYINLFNLFNFDFSDCILFISYCLYPNYFFDELSKNTVNNKIIVFKMINYLKLLREIFYDIKKRYDFIPLVEWI